MFRQKMVSMMEATADGEDDMAVSPVIVTCGEKSVSQAFSVTMKKLVKESSVTDGDNDTADKSQESRVIVLDDQDEDGTSVAQSSASRLPRTYSEYPYPPRVDHRWPSGIPEAAYIQQRRTSYPYCHQPYQHPFLPSPVPPTHPIFSRKLSSSVAMDYVPSPESFYAPEFSKSAVAASPNSLYMSDQERHDIQNTLNNGILGQTCTGSDMALVNAEPDFDLNPQYENSNSLEGYLGGMLKDTMLPGTSEASLSMQSAIGSEKQTSNEMLGFMDTMRSELKQEGPTLAELNMDPYLFEDIYSIIGEEENLYGLSAVKQVVGNVKKQATSTRPVKTETSTSTYSSVSPFGTHHPQAAPTPSQTEVPSATSSISNIFGLKPQNVAVVPPISVTSTSIKTEPMDTCDASGKSCLHKMLSTPPLKPFLSTAAPLQTPSPPRQVMHVVGQSRAPSLAQQPMKSESVEEKWKEIEKFIHDPELASGRKRKRHASGGSAIMSDDEDFNRHTDNMTDDDDSDSDIDSDFSDTPLEESLTELAKKSKQYFWQYNVQAKGPKGTRLKLQINDPDPHHPSTFEDPVFDANSTSLVGIRHGGKARKGDGNEVSPNPRKLCQLGQQLYKLNRQINNCQVSNDLPAHIRNKSRKEKNKLASRACRLKKKAQHEANKIKLMGLDNEQSELLEVIHDIWPQLKQRAQRCMKGKVLSPGSEDTLSAQLEDLVKLRCRSAIAGNTTDYVNDVIRKVENGDPTGGLPIKPKVKK